MTIFKFTDYRLFLRRNFSNSPKKGRGKLSELARHLRIHPTVVSQVFSGNRNFSEEQALEISDFLGLSEVETRYFRLLLRLAAAESAKLRAALMREIDTVREASERSHHIRKDIELSDHELAIFYSSWLYSATRLFCSTGVKTADDVSQRFHIGREKAVAICNFLQTANLIVADGKGFRMGPQTTFIDRRSPFVSKHHTNWRIKGIEASESIGDGELMFTGPFSVSRAHFPVVRERIAAMLLEFSAMVKESPAEELACLNVDLFRIRN